MPDDSFREFIRRIRAGDAEAATQVVQRYEAAIRMEVRMRLRRRGRRAYPFESGDICQSVLASFFVRMATGQYDLSDPRRLQNLLLAMARRKVEFRLRTEHAERRDPRRLVRNGAAALEGVGNGLPPDRIVAGKDLLQQVSLRLTKEEWQLAERRAKGLRWTAIAAELGGTAQSRRKQLARALDRVLRQIGLEDPFDE
jgi:RNA polymerase sigma-70 factor (ECF subfamily)